MLPFELNVYKTIDTRLGYSPSLPTPFNVVVQFDSLKT